MDQFWLAFEYLRIQYEVLPYKIEIVHGGVLLFGLWLAVSLRRLKSRVRALGVDFDFIPKGEAEDPINKIELVMPPHLQAAVARLTELASAREMLCKTEAMVENITESNKHTMEVMARSHEYALAQLRKQIGDSLETIQDVCDRQEPDDGDDDDD